MRKYRSIFIKKVHELPTPERWSNVYAGNADLLLMDWTSGKPLVMNGTKRDYARRAIAEIWFYAL